jgi:catechol 2,3-dioxygenase
VHPDEPVFDLTHLGHVELLTPKPEASLRFFLDVMGLTVRRGGRPAERSP